jgi:hypothetical protein
MTSVAVSDIDASLFYASGSSGSTMTVAGEVTKLGIPELTWPTVEVTNTSTSGSGYKEFIFSGEKIIGEFGISVSFIKANLNNYIYYSNAKQALNYQIRFNDSGSTIWTFTGLCTSVKVKDVDRTNASNLSADIKILASGSMTMS